MDSNAAVILKQQLVKNVKIIMMMSNSKIRRHSFLIPHWWIEKHIKLWSSPGELYPKYTHGHGLAATNYKLVSFYH